MALRRVWRRARAIARLKRQPLDIITGTTLTQAQPKISGHFPQYRDISPNLEIYRES